MVISNITDTDLERLIMDPTYDKFLNVLDLMVASKKKARLLRDIEPIESWVNSQYYLGSMAQDLYPYWKDEIIDFFDTGKTEWIITGSIGTGKTIAANVAYLRKIYELSCYDIPARLFGLADITKIMFAYFSVSATQAKLTGFSDFKEMLDHIPYFNEHYKRDPNIDSMMIFPSKVYVLPGSSGLHVIGTALFGAFLDEANFYTKGGSSSAGDLEKANKLYSQTTERRQSRFASKGEDHGISLLISSVDHESSFTEARIANSTGDNKITIARLWSTKPKGTYSTESFYVYIGTKRTDPALLKDVDQLRFHLSLENREAVEKLLPPSVIFLKDAMMALTDDLRLMVLKVPIDFKKSFDTNLVSALKNIGGISSAPAGKLFTNRKAYNICLKKAPSLEHPFKKNSFVISNMGDEKVETYFLEDILFEKDEYGDSTLIRHPGQPRFVHIDQSAATDCTGFGIVHLAEWEVDEETGYMLPHLELDLALQVIPPNQPDRLSIAKIRHFIFYLRRLGMKLGCVSYDFAMSEESLQAFSKHMINNKRISVDRYDREYITLANMFLEGRLSLYDYPPFEQELFDLNHDRVKHKVDHPKTRLDGKPGSKDVADGICGAVSSCLIFINENPDVGEGLKEIKTSYHDEADDGDFDEAMLTRNILGIPDNIVSCDGYERDE